MKPTLHHIPICPFSQRLEILLHLKGLSDAVDFSVVDITVPRDLRLLEEHGAEGLEKQRIDKRIERYRKEMAGKRITRLVKSEDGSGHFELIDPGHRSWSSVHHAVSTALDIRRGPRDR